MLRKLAGLVVLAILVSGCGRSDVKTPARPAGADSKVSVTSESGANSQFALEDFVVGEPVRFENLTIFPVASRVPKTDDRFITLDEGLKTGTVEIREVSAAAAVQQSLPSVNPALAETDEDALADPLLDQAVGGNDVNSLIVVNNSDKPLYLMPGEIIIGGSQDRTIGEELVVAAHSQPMKVPVFCVEHGRWGTKGVEETLQQLEGANGSTVLGDSVSLSIRQNQTVQQVAEEADKGKFVASIGQLGKTARVAVQSDKDQSAVWEKVAETNAKSGLRPISGAFTANYSDVENVKRLEPYLESLQTPVAKHDQVVGVLVAINGKIESIDLFESTPLFLKIWPKLLKSYSLDAMNATAESTNKPTDCTRAAALSFFGETLQANVASSDAGNGIGLVKRDGLHVLSFSSHFDSTATPAAMGGMGGGMGGGVHFSGFAK